MRKMYSFSEAVPGVCHRTFLTAIVLAAPAILLSQPAESVPGTPDPRACESRAMLLPVDDPGYEFDNIADVLSVSPGLLKRNMLVGRRSAREAVGDQKRKPLEEGYTDGRRGGRGASNERVSDD